MRLSAPSVYHPPNTVLVRLVYFNEATKWKVNVSTVSPFAVLCCFLCKINSRFSLTSCAISAGADMAEMKEYSMVLFESVSQYFERLDSKSCDKVLRSGTAQAFAKSLHDLCVLHEQSQDARVSDKEDSKTVRNSRILHITVLCKALALILRCSDSELQSQHYSTMKQHLSVAVPCVPQMMLASKGYGTLPLTTVGNAVRIMHRIAPLLDQLPSEFLQSAAPLLDGQLPANVRADAALSLVCFLTHKSSQMYKLEKEDGNRLVSVLCVSATTGTEAKMEEAMEALAALVSSGPYFARIARQKCCVLAAKQNLVHKNKAIRRGAFEIFVSVVDSHELENGPAGIFESNMDYIVQGLVEGATTESEINLFRDILDLLVRLVNSEKSPIGASKNAEILKTLARKAATTEDGYDQRTEHSAVCYLRAALKSLHNADILCRVVDLTASPHTPVRSKALVMLQDLLFWRPSMAETLLRQTTFLMNMSMIIRNEAAQERAVVMETCKTLISDQANHCHFLRCDDFVNALVNFITSSATKDLPALVTALDILLDLMLTQERSVDYFLKNSDVLPWMVALANRTSCNDLKVRLIMAIQRMTLRLMNEND